MPSAFQDSEYESFGLRLRSHHKTDARWSVGRAPARLDVLGGVADYSGSLVLESTLACGTFAAASYTTDGNIMVTSSILLNGDKFHVTLPLTIMLNADGSLLDFDDIRTNLTSVKSSRWAAYPVGCLYVLLASGWLDVTSMTGLTLYLESDVPIGAGVSSSASLEVATMTAIAAAYNIQMDGMEIARLCQIVENRVVGAPCGIMDQVTCSMGKAGKLLSLECRPHNLQEYVNLPEGWSLAAIDSGV